MMISAHSRSPAAADEPDARCEHILLLSENTHHGQVVKRMRGRGMDGLFLSYERRAMRVPCVMERICTGGRCGFLGPAFLLRPIAKQRKKTAVNIN